MGLRHSRRRALEREMVSDLGLIMLNKFLDTISSALCSMSTSSLLKIVS